MQVSVLGPTEVTRAGQPVDLGTRKQRALVAALVLHRDRAVGVDTLVDLLWGDAPPASVGSTLHAYVAGLRRALEPDRPPRAPATVLVTTDAGYALRVPQDAVDACRFVDGTLEVHAQLHAGRGPDDLPGVSADLTTTDLAALDERLTGLLAGWRGTPYAELDDAPAARAEAARLAELRLLASEDRALVRIVLGHASTVVSELEALTGEHPLRESLWELRVTALAAAGRQADALSVLRSVRSTLSEELGIDPGPALQRLETAVLRQEAVVPVRPAVRAPRRVAERGPEPSPVVGRDSELRALDALLAPALAGQPQLAVLVGEAGIGKSRLAAAYVERAAEQGFAVAVGRCSEAEGAPPLWPWTSVFAALRDQELLDEGTGGGALDLLLGTAGSPDPGRPVGSADEAAAAQFRTWDALTELLRTATARRPLLLLLDDVHWADASSARLLQHVVERSEAGRLVVVVTRRRYPEPSGPLADLAAALGRRHALQLSLTGLDADATAQLVAATTGDQPRTDQAERLRARTDGNPFFLVELLRWTAMSEDRSDVPAGVTDVVARRVGALPTATQDLLRTAAVVGHAFDLSLLAAASGSDEDSALDLLEPALAAGVVRDEGTVDRFRFSHALVRDAVYAGLPPSRRARRHAAVAGALDARAASGRTADTRSETAWHWLAAGPAHARRAWQAAQAAAASATAVHAHEDAAGLLGAALQAAEQDGELQPLERYDLLMARAHACRWAGDGDAVRAALDAAVEEAERLGDVERVAAAVITTTQGMLWTSGAYGVVVEHVVRTLEDVLRRLPAADSELRCRVLLVLASERYYADGPRQQRALVDEGLAMARRLGDPALLSWSCQLAATAIWRPSAREERFALAEEALAAADQAEDAAARVHARVLLAIAAMESGRIGLMRREVAVGREQADRLRLAFPLVVLDTLHLPWLAMAGRFEEAERLMSVTLDLLSRTTLEPKGSLAMGAVMPLRVWQGRGAELVPQVRNESHLSGSALALLLVRTGQLDELRVVADQYDLSLAQDDWYAGWPLAIAAEVAAVLGLRKEGAAVYARLAPLAGGVASAGSGFALGPVDAFLALAAAAAGEPTTAGRHADEAAALCGEWEIPLVGQWLEAHRQRLGF